MAKFDPALLPAVESVTETKTFRLGENGPEWAFTFRVDAAFTSDLFVGDKTREIKERFVGDNAETIAAPGRPPIRVSPILCDMIASLMACEVEADADSPVWEFAHWVIFAERAPETFMEVHAWHTDLVRKASGAPEAPPADETGSPVALPKND